MNYMRPLPKPVTPIALSDSQKNALATALREARENARQAEALRANPPKPTQESCPAATEELLFIL
jgi:hypothetical protein